MLYSDSVSAAFFMRRLSCQTGSHLKQRLIFVIYFRFTPNSGHAWRGC
jgi:hypothetical protein